MECRVKLKHTRHVLKEYLITPPSKQACVHVCVACIVYEHVGSWIGKRPTHRPPNHGLQVLRSRLTWSDNLIDVLWQIHTNLYTYLLNSADYHASFGFKQALHQASFLTAIVVSCDASTLWGDLWSLLAYEHTYEHTYEIIWIHIIRLKKLFYE